MGVRKSLQERMEKKNINHEAKEMYNYSNERDCFFHRMPIEIIQIITEVVEEEKMRVETVGYRYKNQLLEWSNHDSKQKISLLYKASRDGFTGIDFHSKCDNEGETWTVIQDVKGNIFGGYTKFSWNSIDDSVFDPNAYIFTLVNPHNIPPTKYKVTPGYQHSINDFSGFSPMFGGGVDIYVSEQSDTNKRSCFNFPKSYVDSTGKAKETFTGDRCFKSKEIEVWGECTIIRQ